MTNDEVKKEENDTEAADLYQYNQFTTKINFLF